VNCKKKLKTANNRENKNFKDDVGAERADEKASIVRDAKDNESKRRCHGTAIAAIAAAKQQRRRRKTSAAQQEIRWRRRK
jgi:hypothetical protein